MDRRTKERLDLQLVCRVGRRKVRSEAIHGSENLTTENFSRNGILLRWLPDVEVPALGSKLTVDVGLPTAPGTSPRAMRCSAEVVRIEHKTDHHHLVAVTIGKIRFVPADLSLQPDLSSMRPATSRVN